MAVPTAAEGRAEARTPSRWERWAGLGGALYALSVIIGDDLVTGEPPSIDASRTDVVRYLAEQNSDPRQWLGRLIALLGLGLLMLFVTKVWSVLRRAEERPAWLSSLALGSGLVAVATLLVTYGLLSAFVLGEEGAPSVETATLAFYLAGTFFVLAWFPLAVFLGAVAAVVLRTGVLPSWFGWASAVQAIAFLVALALLEATLAGFLALLLWWLWLLVASIVVIRHG